MGEDRRTVTRRTLGIIDGVFALVDLLAERDLDDEIVQDALKELHGSSGYTNLVAVVTKATKKRRLKKAG
jgi:hypothetical protein